MSEYKPLSTEQIKNISREYFEDRLTESTSQPEPMAILVGGQSGAGKTEAGKQAADQLNAHGGYMHVDADRMREEIPSLDGYRPTSAETQADAGQLVREFRALTVQEKHNFIEEGTFRDAEAFTGFVDRLYQEGYRVELHAVATPKELSLLGIYQRFEEQHKNGAANPRFVPESFHETAFNGFNKTFAATESKLDRVVIVNRNGQTLYDSVTANDMGGAVRALEQGQRMTPQQAISAAKAWEQVKGLAEGRKAEPEHLERIAVNLKAAHSLAGSLQQGNSQAKESLRETGDKVFLQNFNDLQEDPRYAKHSLKELTSAAYFRGISEAMANEKGEPFDQEKYDNVMAARTTAARLPEVEDPQIIAVAKGADREYKAQKYEGHSL
jgi:UDP-N-acetylglucosamine kinase